MSVRTDVGRSRPVDRIAAEDPVKQNPAGGTEWVQLPGCGTFFHRDLLGVAICHSVFRASSSSKPQFFQEIAKKCHSMMAAPRFPSDTVSPPKLKPLITSLSPRGSGDSGCRRFRQ